MGLKKIRTDPWWKRRIEESLIELQKHISLLDRHKKGQVKSKRKIEKLHEKYWINEKGINTVLEELKQRALAKKPKLERYSEKSV